MRSIRLCLKCSAVVAVVASLAACAVLAGCSAVRPASTRITPGTASSAYTKLRIVTPNDRDRGGVLAVQVVPADPPAGGDR